MRSRLFPILLLLALPAAAQPPASPEEEPFTDQIQVSVVNLDVFVTDKQGKPVEGLEAKDFEVLEDGRPVKVTNFYHERRPTAAAPAAVEGQAGQKAEDRPLDRRQRLVVFVDDVNTGPASRAKILGQVGPFLRQSLAPGDEVMLVRYTQSLDVRRSFTSDLGQIDADLAVLGSQSSDMRQNEASLEHAYEDIAAALEGDTSGPVIEGRLRAWADQESAAVKGALQALDSVVSWLAGVPGRKAILYVSDGLPLTPGQDLFTQFAQGNTGPSHTVSGMASKEFDLSRQFRAVTSHASRNRITFYPIEVFNTGITRGSTTQSVRVNERQNGLRFLAEDTGGRALINAASPLTALQLVEQDFASYYSLGYTPDRPGDEAEHKIEVRVKVRGAQARYRQWYRDKPTGEGVAERTLAVMRFGPEDNPLGASLEIRPAREQDGAILVPVRVKVPIAKLYLQPGEKARTGRLRLYVVASGEGVTTPVKETKVVTVELPDAAAGSTREYVHDVGIPLKPGRWSIGVAVRDELAATTSYLRKELRVPGIEGSARR
jgi:VWFA-related protein